MGQPTRTTDKLGRLSAFGIKEAWQAALLLPRKWTDLSRMATEFPGEDQIDGQEQCLVLHVASPPKLARGRGAPRTVFQFTDARGVSGYATIWGDGRAIAARLKPGKRAALLAKPGYWNGNPQLDVSEWIHPRWLNKLRPVYPGKPKVIGAAKVRDRVIALLPDAIPTAAETIRKRLAKLGSEAEVLARARAPRGFADIETVLWQAHLPDSEAVGEQAHAIIDRIAALDMLLDAQDQARSVAVSPLKLSLASRSKRANALPFALTDEQEQALEEITEDLRRPEPMHRLLTGDVGTGKTAVYGTAIAMAADAGARVAVMLPNIGLAGQIHAEMREWWPDLDIRLVEAGGPKGADKEGAVVVGTTALLSADVGSRDLVVVDEQQKFSRAQREKLAALDTHLLEVSATCIPRSQALVAFGVADLSRLTRGHVEKTLHTRVRGKDERRELFQDCAKTVQDNHQLAIVYPAREDDAGEEGAMKSASAAAKAWENYFPGRVRLVHGAMSSEEKKAALEDMKTDKADVLVSTTVIEVGLTLPRLRRLLVIDAERYGLTTLHQLRGRLARKGGEGHFDLFLSRDVPEHVTERLQCLEKTTDGFELAEMDLRLRGYGDLAGEQQHGEASTLIVSRGVDYERMAEVADSMMGAREKPAPVDWVDSMDRLAESEAPALARAGSAAGDGAGGEDPEDMGLSDDEAIQRAFRFRRPLNQPPDGLDRVTEKEARRRRRGRQPSNDPATPSQRAQSAQLFGFG